MPDCPIIPKCCNTDVYSYSIGDIFYSQRTEANCPDGYTGGPFVSEFARFTSTVSQADADSQATAYLDEQLALNCRSVVDYFILEMLGPVDDDVNIQINGITPEQRSPETIFYWDYTSSQWTTIWTSTEIPTPIPSGPTTFPITSIDRQWNVEWYAGLNYLVENFVKIKYTGPLFVGDSILIQTLDCFQSQYITSPWTLTIYYTDGSSQVINGGVPFTGVSPNLPSPPRYNPASAPPYNSAVNLAAFLGIPNYISQGYSSAGPFFFDYYPNGFFLIPPI